MEHTLPWHFCWWPFSGWWSVTLSKGKWIKMVTLNDLVQGLSHGSPEQGPATTGIVRFGTWKLSLSPNSWCVKLGKWKPGAAFSPHISESSTTGWTTLNGNASTVQGCNDPRNSADKIFACYLLNWYHPWINVSVQKSFTHDVCIYRCNFGISGSKGCLAYLFHRSNLPSLSTLVYLRLTTLWRFFRTNSPKMELQICGMFFVDVFLYQDYIVTLYQLYAKRNIFWYQQKYWENPL